MANNKSPRENNELIALLKHIQYKTTLLISGKYKRN